MAAMNGSHEPPGIRLPPMSPSRSHPLPIDPAGRRIAWVLIALLVFGFGFAWTWLWILAILGLTIVLGFFRDPPRRVPRIPGAVVSPADGRIVSITPNQDPHAGPLGGPCIAIFLSVFDVHVNRAPFDGAVHRIHYVPGMHLDARDPQAARRNESNWIYITCGRLELTVRQIAGLIARRIVCRVREGQPLRRGQRLGIIMFGSRTELYLPPEARVQVEVGQMVKGGLSILAFLPEESAE
jgi:phosphatidylserine decarboxylase